MDIKEYIEELEANGFAKNTIRSYKQILERLNDFKELKDITKEDLVKFFRDFKGTDETKRLYQTKIKKFFKDLERAEVAEWIKPVRVKEKLTADDILTTEDINKLIESTGGIYWKALIAFLFESGCRISEAKALKSKDFKETNEGMIVDIPTMKTASGFRRTALILSADYIRNLRVYSNSPPDSVIFHISASHTQVVLNEISNRAGIKKPVTPHAFRHAQATIMVQQGYNEAIIRKKLGWTPGSTMIARYQHLNDNDVVEATLKNNGKTPEKLIITEIKQAEKITLVDAAMQFSKLSQENETLKTELKKLKSLVKKIAELQNMTSIEELEAETYFEEAESKKEERSFPPD
ncbi:site-specific recombinase XerD [Candidatus Methanoperedens nitroreducens]|uniref:Site-specific recombinase XerD n=1 Tax=Candidatus Methanoperedens nitratireducens TaxID=1392998 RepID=A0A062V121_9EURY|nr:tyrosine-type recombinase/integrase [Candidatus Methanoperedens nitroreducens]KCZ71082.1 site-specific recombinase XerD [Candidatus Methanoperedens nitroreducens]MDJ1421545.1 tyrosine-type recombinase/integrase [Candidatus Methanoperedens sp.]